MTQIYFDGSTRTCLTSRPPAASPSMLSIASLQINLHLLSHCIFIFNLDRCDVPWLPSSSSREEFALVDWCRDTLEFLKSCSLLFTYYTFFHHYQRSIDFNTVNIHRTVGMYFLVSTRNRGDMIYRDHIYQYTPCSDR